MALCGFAGHNFDATILIKNEHCTMQIHAASQDVDGNFSETLSWLVEYQARSCRSNGGPRTTVDGHGHDSSVQDPHVVSHPAAALAADLIWFRFAVFYFLRGVTGSCSAESKDEQMFNCCTALLINLIPNLYETKNLCFVPFVLVV